jgi:hypothetical protein
MSDSIHPCARHGFSEGSGEDRPAERAAVTLFGRFQLVGWLLLAIAMFPMKLIAYQTVGAAASSAIDFGSGASALVFADSHLSGWTGILSILNYTTGIDSLKFGTSASGLTADQLSQINFGPGILAQISATGVVTGLTAIPETVDLCRDRGRRDAWVRDVETKAWECGGSSLLGFSATRRASRGLKE